MMRIETDSESAVIKLIIEREEEEEDRKRDGLIGLRIILGTLVYA